MRGFLLPTGRRLGFGRRKFRDLDIVPTTSTTSLSVRGIKFRDLDSPYDSQDFFSTSLVFVNPYYLLKIIFPAKFLRKKSDIHLC